ncbi:hypothetical protein HDU86_005393 [Geranomyces michiganensis]|nr:hypothetical protein HDU86_005393 [Geranomyces michiganensis]
MAEGAGAAKTSASATNPVFRDAIHAETVRKELRLYKIYDNYMLTPAVEKGLVVAEKPNRINIQDIEKNLDKGDGDQKSSASKTAVPRPLIPLTSNETYGWHTVPLMRNTDPRFFHPKVETEITKMYGALLVKKEPGEAKAKAAA